MGYQLNNDQFRQLEMFRPAGELYREMVDNEVGSSDVLGEIYDVDLDDKDHGSDWADAKRTVHRPIVRYFDDAVGSGRVSNSAVTNVGSGREFQGDGHHRVTTYGRHAPKTEIPILYSNEDIMAPADTDRQWDRQEKTRLRWQTRHG